VGRNTTAKARWREGRREGVSQEFLRVLPSRVCAFAVVFLLGCVPKGGAERPHIKYTGPTLTLEELVRQINAQNGRIKTLWASGEFDCTVLDEKKNEQRIDGDNLLINYRKPGELRRTQCLARCKLRLATGLGELVPWTHRKTVIAAVDAVAHG